MFPFILACCPYERSYIWRKKNEKSTVYYRHAHPNRFIRFDRLFVQTGGGCYGRAGYPRKSYENMQEVKSFHFVLEHNEGGTPIGSGIVMTKAEGDVVKPDKLKATITGTAMNMTVSVDLVTAEGKTMMTNPLNKKWEELTEQFQVLGVFDPSTGIGAIVKDITNPTSLDDEKIGSTLCYHIKGDIVSQALEPITGVTAKDIPVSVEVWIDKDGFLVQQITLTGKITDSEEDGIVSTLTISNYDKDVDISLPE
jgi:hypothetical protein